MEFNFKDKFTHLFNCKNSNKIKTDSTEHDKHSKLFHIDCKYSRKKICNCKSNDSSRNKNIQNDKDFSNFLIDLIDDKIDLKVDQDSRKISFTKKDFNSIKYVEQRNSIEKERLKNMDYNKTKYFVKNSDELRLLSYADYKEIEKNINDDKKICENCKTNIYENNYHKGWKNEAGELVLLCSMCSKKYFNGALEIKFDKLNEMIPINKVSQQSSQIIIKEAANSTMTIINTSRPVEDHFLSNKRLLESGMDLVCSNKICNKFGKKNEFLNCAKCNKYCHPSCTEPSVVMKFVNRFKWLCNNCKTCQICDSVKDEKLSRCATCDRTFHPSCHTSIVSPMNKKTYCTDCINCKNCLKTLPLLTVLNQNDFISIKGYRVCDECWKYYKNVKIYFYLFF